MASIWVVYDRTSEDWDKSEMVKFAIDFVDGQAPTTGAGGQPATNIRGWGSAGHQYSGMVFSGWVGGCVGWDTPFILYLPTLS
eukprot:COSAG05_NODE_94_length_19565_cov_15.870133_7_plen_83_part_00